MGERFLSIVDKFNNAVADMALKALNFKRDEYYTKKDVMWGFYEKGFWRPKRYKEER